MIFWEKFFLIIMNEPQPTQPVVDSGKIFKIKPFFKIILCFWAFLISGSIFFNSNWVQGTNLNTIHLIFNEFIYLLIIFIIIYKGSVILFEKILNLKLQSINNLSLRKFTKISLIITILMISTVLFSFETNLNSNTDKEYTIFTTSVWVYPDHSKIAYVENYQSSNYLVIQDMNGNNLMHYVLNFNETNSYHIEYIINNHVYFLNEVSNTNFFSVLIDYNLESGQSQILKTWDYYPDQSFVQNSTFWDLQEIKNDSFIQQIILTGLFGPNKGITLHYNLNPQIPVSVCNCFINLNSNIFSSDLSKFVIVNMSQSINNSPVVTLNYYRTGNGNSLSNNSQSIKSVFYYGGIPDLLFNPIKWVNDSLFYFSFYNSDSNGTSLHEYNLNYEPDYIYSSLSGNIDIKDIDLVNSIGLSSNPIFLYSIHNKDKNITFTTSYKFSSWNLKNSEILIQNAADQFSLYDFNSTLMTINLKSIISGNFDQNILNDFDLIFKLTLLMTGLEVLISLGLAIYFFKSKKYSLTSDK